MKRPVPVESAFALIDEKIKELGDWRGKRLAKVREIIHEPEEYPRPVDWRATIMWQDHLQEGDEVVGAIRNPR
jgi:hypothetical protein